MLIVVGGLPGTGKTTIARALAEELAAMYIRIDTIEQALSSSGAVPGDMGPHGYVVAYAVADCARYGAPGHSGGSGGAPLSAPALSTRSRRATRQPEG
jgi:predicted kinase